MAIYRAPVRSGLIQKGQRKKVLKEFTRWERSRSMELWQMDVVGSIFTTDGTEAKILTGIDDHSRFIVCSGVMARATARPVCEHFVGALERWGVPEEILTDNGKVFTGRFGRNDTEVLFDKICRENGITHRLTQPAHPTTTGKIERWHYTLRREFVGENSFTSLEDLQEKLNAWVHDYNTERPHQEMLMATPLERFSRRTLTTNLPLDASATLYALRRRMGEPERSPPTASSPSAGRSCRRRQAPSRPRR